MIQVDLFLSFAIGASLAAAAGDKLKNVKCAYVNEYFVYTVCYLGLVFAPSGIYFLWQHPGWETMFFYDRTELHGIVPCLFTVTNVLFGIVGFQLSYRLVRSDREAAAHGIWTTAVTCMLAIWGFGYDRALYPGLPLRK